VLQYVHPKKKVRLWYAWSPSFNLPTNLPLFIKLNVNIMLLEVNPALHFQVFHIYNCRKVLKFITSSEIVNALQYYWIPWIRSQPIAIPVPTNVYKTQKNAEISTYMHWAGSGLLVLFFKQWNIIHSLRVQSFGMRHYTLVYRCKCHKGTYCFHLQSSSFYHPWKMKYHIPLKCWYLSTIQHGISYKNTIIALTYCFHLQSSSFHLPCRRK
jgi:hypothetical protein